MKPRLHPVLASALLLLATASSALAQAPVAHWSFDRLDRGVFPGSGPAARPASVSGKVEPTPGRAGQALSFADTPVGQVNIPLDLARVSPDGSFTLDFWLRPMGRAQPYGTCVDVGGARGFVIRTNNTGRLSFSSGGTWNVFASERPLDEQIWAHVALVHQGGKATLYLNGREIGSSDLDLTRLAPVVQLGSVTERVRLPEGGTRDEIAKPLIGDLDELRIHARALSAAEIATLARPTR